MKLNNVTVGDQKNGGGAYLIKRRESREAAFALLYEWSFRYKRKTIKELIALAEEARGFVYDDYLLTIAELVEKHTADIDEKIQLYSDKWKIHRISKINLTALRLSFAEILYLPDIPHSASINEAIELVKKYGTEDEAAFLNGVLGGFVRAEFSEE